MLTLMNSGRRHERGFSLIEVLVAMLVLAIGLLGLAALQAQGMRFNHDSYVRTSATNLASDIIDKMRIHRAGFTDADFLAAQTAVYTTLPTTRNCSATASSVQNDLECWLTDIERSLPLGRATISSVAGMAGGYDITIMWLDREPRGAAGLATSANCGDLANRAWVNGNCMVQQTWSVWP